MADLIDVLNQTVFLAQIFFAWGLISTITLVGSWILVSMFTPAIAFIKAKFGNRVIVDSIRRDNRSNYRPCSYEHGYLKDDKGYYTVIPGTNSIYKGTPKFICFEETGVPMHPAHAAASGLMKSVGIPDAEVMEIFNVYLKDPANFDAILGGLRPLLTEKDEEAIRDEVSHSENQLSEADIEAIRMDRMMKNMANSTDYFVYPVPQGTFSNLLEHTRRVLGVRDNEALKRLFEAMKGRIPEIKEGSEMRKQNHPVWWTKKDGVGCNILGMAVNYSNVKDLQIYHIDPSTGRNIAKQEAYRLYEKMKSARSDIIVKAAVAFAIIGGVIIFGYLILNSTGGNLPNIIPTIP